MKKIPGVFGFYHVFSPTRILCVGLSLKKSRDEIQRIVQEDIKKNEENAEREKIYNKFDYVVMNQNLCRMLPDDLVERIGDELPPFSEN